MTNSDTFAYLDAKSTDARKSLDLYHNRRLTRDRRQARSQLRFAYLLGRRCLALGSSRSNEILVTPARDVTTTQFILHFDVATQTLQLTDKSSSGTWYRTNNTSEYTLLYQTSIVLVQKVWIAFGNRRRFRFLISPIDIPANTSPLRCWFNRYIHSIQHIVDVGNQTDPSRPSRAPKRRRSSMEMETHSGYYNKRAKIESTKCGQNQPDAVYPYGSTLLSHLFKWIQPISPFLHCRENLSHSS